MSSVKKSVSLKNSIKLIIDESGYLSEKKSLNIDSLVDAIKSANVIHINGSFGTGKAYLVNEIFIPELKKNYELSQINFSEKNLLSVNDSDIKFERLNKERLIIVSSKYLQKNNEQTDSALITRLKHLAELGHDICLNDVQDQFLELPNIIESLTKKHFGISIDKIEVVIVGYLEMLIRGFKNNLVELEDYVKADDPNDWKEDLSLYFPNKTYLLSFNNFIKTNQKRNSIWKSFLDKSQTISLSKIATFNDRFQKTWSNIGGDVALGVRKKHPKIIVLERIIEYCKALLPLMGIDTFNKDQAFEPINTYINRLKSGDYTINSSIENVYFFKKSLERHSTDFSKYPIIYFDTLKITQDYDEKYILQTFFQLIGESVETPKIRLTPSKASFLIYLAIERQHKGKNWLLDSADHQNVLDIIISKLELEPDLEFDNNNLDQDVSWFDDYRNKFRRKIVSDINTLIKNKCSVRYNIFKSVDVDPRNKGVYTLIKSIRKIKLTWKQL